MSDVQPVQVSATEALGRQIVRAAHDMFGMHFQPTESWSTWLEVVLPALYGLPIAPDKLPIFQRATGRTAQFSTGTTEAWFLCGRRSGKSRFLALMAVCLALFRDYSAHRAPGERVVIMILAADKGQAQSIFQYAYALIDDHEMLKSQVLRAVTEDIELANGVTISIQSNSYRSVRGRTLAAALCDEAAFWRSEDSSNPAEAVIRALRPALSTIPGAPLLVASSTYTADGILFDAYARHWGKDASNVMVWRADTQTMNPSFSQAVLDQAYADDAKDAAAEYGSEWLADVRQFLTDELVNAAIVVDRKSLPKTYGPTYVAFTDPSGGVNDAMTLAIAHAEDGLVVLDRLEVIQAPFKPEEAVQRFADILSGYGLNAVTGDQYAAQWVSSTFTKYGIGYAASDRNKSQIYVAAQPLFSQRVVELLDHPKMAGELRRLERRARSGGQDKVDHPRGAHDDLANAVCGALVLAARQPSTPRYRYNDFGGGRHVGGTAYDPYERDDRERERAMDNLYG